MERSEYRFIVDRMLGRLISWLRIFGYDTKSALELDPSPKEDTMLIEIALGEGRILVSRDRVLVNRAKKAGVQAVLMYSDDVRDQLEALMQHYGLDIDPNMTRCTVCNSTLREAGPSDFENIKKHEEVPEHLLKNGTLFWICDRCGKVYWQGSHWRNILRTAEEVKNNHQNI
ncbi:hypothetical protein CUJ83_09245 [Methanocella sp. CWC-04]|uniref:Mut7-C RNAse domain-containing protein n=1 Tax=Methanooceanicella nereidis TaxID=2052831 RepID=A0AAP2W6E0_9EURY|nr:Mut7-C RNAse domain-containing protein [Methanocella sp. CWC-04]MCD1295182.1 hypothetical protein [Methanocella sp. CWC-04]